MQGAFTLFTLAYKHNKSKIKRLLLLAILFEIVSVIALYYLNLTYGVLYQGIQDYNTTIIWHSIAKFAGIAGLLVLINGQLGYVLTQLGFAIRLGLTDHVLSGDFNHVPMLAQRIQEDLKYYGELVVEVAAAVFKAAIKLPVFVGVIVTLTQWWVGAIIVGTVVIGTILTRIAGKRLVPMQAQQETNEAEFRSEIAEGRKGGAYYKFTRLTFQFHKIAAQTKKLSYVTSGLSQGFVLLPFIVLMPLYIAKSIPMGQFFQSVNALGKIIDSLTILIDSRQMIVQLESVLLRLTWLSKK